MSVEVVVLEDGQEVERVDLDRRGYVVLCSEKFEQCVQEWPKSGTVQVTIKRSGDSQ